MELPSGWRTVRAGARRSPTPVRGHLHADRVEHLVLVRHERLADEVSIVATDRQGRTEVEMRQRCPTRAPP